MESRSKSIAPRQIASVCSPKSENLTVAFIQDYLKRHLGETRVFHPYCPRIAPWRPANERLSLSPRNGNGSERSLLVAGKPMVQQIVAARQVRQVMSGKRNSVAEFGSDLPEWPAWDTQLAGIENKCESLQLCINLNRQGHLIDAIAHEWDLWTIEAVRNFCTCQSPGAIERNLSAFPSVNISTAVENLTEHFEYRGAIERQFFADVYPHLIFHWKEFFTCEVARTMEELLRALGFFMETVMPVVRKRWPIALAQLLVDHFSSWANGERSVDIFAAVAFWQSKLLAFAINENLANFERELKSGVTVAVDMNNATTIELDQVLRVLMQMSREIPRVEIILCEKSFGHTDFIPVFPSFAVNDFEKYRIHLSSISENESLDERLNLPVEMLSTLEYGQLKEVVAKLKSQRFSILSTPSEYQQGIFLLRNDTVKQKQLHSIGRQLTDKENFLHIELEKIHSKACEVYAESASRLAKSTTSIEKFMAVIEIREDLLPELRRLKEESIAMMEQMFSMDFNCSEKILVASYRISQLPRNLEAVIDSIAENCHLVSMEEAVIAEIQQLNENILSMNRKFKVYRRQLRPTMTIGNLQRLVQFLTEFANKMQTICDQNRILLKQQEVLKFDLASKAPDLLLQKAKLFLHCASLWLKVQQNYMRWHGVLLTELIISDTVRLIDEMKNEAIDLEAELKTEDEECIGPSLQAIVDKIQLTLRKFDHVKSILDAIGSNSLSERHWRLLIADEMPTELTFGCLLDSVCRACDGGKAFAVTDLAKKESTVVDQLHRMQSDWSNVQLNQRSCQGNVIEMLQINDRLHSQIQKQIAETQLLQCSPYAGPLKMELQKWLQTLTETGNFLQKYKQCSDDYIFLSDAFAAPEIVYQLPRETAAVSDWTESWKALNVNLLMNTIAISMVTRNPTVIEQLNDLSERIAPIKSGFFCYVDRKVAQFPRLFLLSRAQAMHIIANSNASPEQIPIERLFPGLTGMQLNEKKEEILTMRYGQHSLQMIAPINVVMLSTERWLREFASILPLSINAAVKTVVNQNANTLPWISAELELMPPGILQLIYDIICTRLFETGLHDKTLQDLLKKLNAIRQKFLSMEDNSKSTTVIGQLIVEKMLWLQTVMKPVTAPSDLVWLTQIRTYLTNDSIESNITIRCLHLEFDYAGEFFCPTFADSTMTCFETAQHRQLQRNILIAYRYSSSRICCLLGPTASGKSTAISDLARRLGLLLLNASTVLEVLRRQFLAAAAGGFWFCIENAEEFLSGDLKNWLMTALYRLDEARRHGISVVLLDDVQLQMHPRFMLFMLGTVMAPELQNALSYLPISYITATAPDFRHVCQVFVRSNRIRQPVLILSILDLTIDWCNRLLREFHCDFRAVTSILGRLSGFLNEGHDEPEYALKAVKDVIYGGLTDEDKTLFQRLITCLLPKHVQLQSIIDIDEQLAGQVQTICKVIAVLPTSKFVDKVIECYNQLQLRRAIIIVGPRLSGKSTILKTANLLHNKLHNDSPERVLAFCGQQFDYRQLLGENGDQLKDGILQKFSRENVPKWIRFDRIAAGTLNSLMTFLDDETPLNKNLKIVIEADCLEGISRSVLSRCGIVRVSDDLITPENLLQNSKRMEEVTQLLQMHSGNVVMQKRIALSFRQLLDAASHSDAIPKYHSIFVDCFDASRIVSVDLSVVSEFIDLLLNARIPVVLHYSTASGNSIPDAAWLHLSFNTTPTDLLAALMDLTQTGYVDVEGLCSRIGKADVTIALEGLHRANEQTNAAICGLFDQRYVVDQIGDVHAFDSCRLIGSIRHQDEFYNSDFGSHTFHLPMQKFQKKKNAPTNGALQVENAGFETIADTINELKTHIVVNDYVKRHITFMYRLLQSSNGHALLIGDTGLGKCSLTILTAQVLKMKIAVYDCAKLPVSSTDLLRKTIRQCVIDGSAQILLFRISDDVSVDKGLMADFTVVQNGNLSIGLFDGQELKQLGEHCRHRAETLETVLRRDLHVVVTMKPETADRMRIECFELFQNDRCIDIYEEWSNEVKFQTVQGMLARAESLKMNPEQVQQPRFVKKLLSFTKRFIETTSRMLAAIEKRTSRYKGGIEKLKRSEQQMDVIQNDILRLQPELLRISAETSALMSSLEKETIQIEYAREVVAANEFKANEAATKAQALKAECELELADAAPALDAAVEALQTLTAQDISTLKTLRKPPYGVQLCMEAVCILLGESPIKTADASGESFLDYWTTGQRILADLHFLARIRGFDKANVSRKTMAIIRAQYLSKTEFDPVKVKQCSLAAEGLCLWVRALDAYDQIASVVEPKKAKMKNAEQQVKKHMRELESKRRALQSVTERLQALSDKFGQMSQKKQDLHSQILQCHQKLARSERLVQAVGGELLRWLEHISQMADSGMEVYARSLFATIAVVHYSAAYCVKRDQELEHVWKLLSFQKQYSIQDLLESRRELLQWQTACGFDDKQTVEDCVIMAASTGPVLVYDPFERLLPIVQEGYGTSIKTADFGTGDDAMHLQSLIKSEQAVYVSCVTPSHATLLEELAVQICSIDFDHYQHRPLQEQLLHAFIIQLQPDLLKQKLRLQNEQAQCQQQVLQMEDEVLDTLTQSQEMDDEHAIQVLARSRTIAEGSMDRDAEMQQVTEDIQQFRKEYRLLADWCAALIQIALRLHRLSPWYRFSTAWMVNVCRRCLKSDTRETLTELQQKVFVTLTDEVSRALIAKHKAIFLELCAVTIGRKTLPDAIASLNLNAIVSSTVTLTELRSCVESRIPIMMLLKPCSEHEFWSMLGSSKEVVTLNIIELDRDRLKSSCCMPKTLLVRAGHCDLDAIEDICDTLGCSKTPVDPSFRCIFLLILHAESSIGRSVLERTRLVTFERLISFKARMMQHYRSGSIAQLHDSLANEMHRSVLFRLCSLHCVVALRSGYGPFAWVGKPPYFDVVVLNTAVSLYQDLLAYKADFTYDLLYATVLEPGFTGIFDNESDQLTFQAFSNWVFNGNDASLRNLMSAAVSDRTRMLLRLEALSETECTRLTGLSPGLVDLLTDEGNREIRTMATAVMQDEVIASSRRDKAPLTVSNSLSGLMASSSYLAELMLHHAQTNSVDLKDVSGLAFGHAHSEQVKCIGHLQRPGGGVELSVSDCSLLNCGYDEDTGYITEVQLEKSQSVAVWLEICVRPQAIPNDAVPLVFFDGNNQRLCNVMARSTASAVHWQRRGARIVAVCPGVLSVS